MPQLDVSTFPTQLIWLAISFIALYVLMSKLALPRIAHVLDARQKRIDDCIAQAEEFRKEAEEALAAYEKALAESKAKAQEMLRETTEGLNKQAEARQKELGDRLAQQIKDGETRIAAAKQAALANVRDVAAEVARTAVEKVAGLAIDAGKASAAVDAALKE